ncbi:hypothetical protein Zmor_008785 [Zophobas morio]|uniref:Uncharacterized protein n=1 Tax=Zophobas morio TaxID=2755281 RepID=A0AA38HM86_9CUCU|nr:hypothetical protein Zmor_008785 [Zophobas morio]
MSSLQVGKTRLRFLTNAPWFVRNDTRHHEIRIKLLTALLKNDVLTLYKQTTGHAYRLQAVELTSCGTARNTAVLRDALSTTVEAKLEV